MIKELRQRLFSYRHRWCAMDVIYRYSVTKGNSVGIKCRVHGKESA